jgi:hypothetical protein
MNKSRIPWLSLLVLLASLPLAAQDNERVMVGENIYVGPNEVLGQVVCIGCSVRVEGKTGEVVAIGGSVDVTGESGEVVAIGGSVDVAGRTHGEAVAVGGSVSVSGEIGGEIVSVFGNVNLAQGAEVDGDVVSVGGRVHGTDVAHVNGNVQVVQASIPIMRFGFLLMLVVLLIGGLVFQPLIAVLTYALMGERRVWVLAETTRSRAGLSFLLGLGIFFASIMVSVLGALPFVWIPIPVWLVMFVFLVVGYTGISYWVGRSMLSSSGALGATLLGAVLVTILQLIPVVGWIAWSVFSCMAMGSALLSGFGTSTDWLIRRSEVDPISRPVQRV